MAPPSTQLLLSEIWASFLTPLSHLWRPVHLQILMILPPEYICHSSPSTCFFITLVQAMEKEMAPHSSTLAWKIPWMEKPGSCSPWGCWGSDRTEQLHFHFSLSCTGEGNGNPLQYSCLENPRDGGAWWAAVSGVTQSRTRLKRFSSSSSRK